MTAAHPSIRTLGLFSRSTTPVHTASNAFAILAQLPFAIFGSARLNAARSYYFRPRLYAPPEVPRGRRGYHGTASAPSRWSGVGLAVKSNFFVEGLLPATSSWERPQKAILKR